jgi:hypothetical protein
LRIIDAVAAGDNDVLNRRFPRHPGYLGDSAAGAQLFHWSYFTGVSGLLHVVYQREERAPATDLLLPFAIAY